MTAKKLDADRIQVEDSVEAIFDSFYTRGFTDGLPIVPPTEDRVLEMLQGSDKSPEEVVASIPPRWGEATVEAIAINAVMAGCLPSYLPVVVAAVRAMCQERFNLAAIQATTNPVTPLVIVNGPIAQQIGVNSGYNCLGQGWRANATIGRAIRLILINVGGATPGAADRATAGQPGKYTFCCAENEASNPWQPLHVERGFEPKASAVTVLGASGTLNIIDSSEDGDGLLKTLAGSMTILGSNDYLFGGEPLLILCPEHAGVLAKAGLSKDEVKKRLFEATKVPLGRFPQNAIERIAHNRSDELGPVGPEAIVPLVRAPEDLVLVVAGGAGQHSVYVPTFGITRSVTVLVE